MLYSKLDNNNLITEFWSEEKGEYSDSIPDNEYELPTNRTAKKCDAIGKWIRLLKNYLKFQCYYHKFMIRRSKHSRRGTS